MGWMLRDATYDGFVIEIIEVRSSAPLVNIIDSAIISRGE